MKPFVRIAAISSVATLAASATLAVVVTLATQHFEIHTKSYPHEKDSGTGTCLIGELGNNEAAVCVNPFYAYAGERWEVRWERESKAIHEETARQFRIAEEQKDWLPSNKTY